MEYPENGAFKKALSYKRKYRPKKGRYTMKS
jgi:hypothetical protein